MVYFVATPIGNLKDISLRALDALKEADVIFCEDTRHSLKLLNAYGIKKPLVACHKFNERSAAEKIVSAAEEGKQVAVISDAGMPVISDPGAQVCAELKRAGVPYTVVPGANAALSALILSAMPSERFAFIGFLPDKQGERRRLLQKYADAELTLIPIAMLILVLALTAFDEAPAALRYSLMALGIVMCAASIGIGIRKRKKR